MNKRKQTDGKSQEKAIFVFLSSNEWTVGVLLRFCFRFATIVFELADEKISAFEPFIGSNHGVEIAKYVLFYRLHWFSLWFDATILVLNDSKSDRCEQDGFQIIRKINAGKLG